MPTRNASATWSGGGLKAGKGEFSGESGVIKGKYNFNTRFGEEPGTNPEELLAAAEAACFSMALSLGLEQNGTPPQRIETKAACTIAQQGGGFKITTIKLDVRFKEFPLVTMGRLSVMPVPEPLWKALTGSA